MKTPEEIKNGLEYCGNKPYCDGDCEYYESDDSYGCKLANDALAYIRQIESRLAQVEMERDLLVSGLEQSCDTCKHRENMSFHAPCNTCSHLYRFNAAERGDTDNWEWRGVCEENAKAKEPHQDGEIR